MTILITGATGFIGSHVARHLLQANQSVRLLVRDIEKAKAAYKSKDYQLALKALDGGADRDIRIFEGN